MTAHFMFWLAKVSLTLNTPVKVTSWKSHEKLIREASNQDIFVFIYFFSSFKIWGMFQKKKFPF